MGSDLSNMCPKGAPKVVHFGVPTFWKRKGPPLRFWTKKGGLHGDIPKCQNSTKWIKHNISGPKWTKRVKLVKHEHTLNTNITYVFVHTPSTRYPIPISPVWGLRDVHAHDGDTTTTNV